MTDGLVVDLGSRSYPIHFVRDAEAVNAALQKATAEGRSSVIVTDHGVEQALAPFLATAFGSIPRLTFPAGEKTKSLQSFGRIQDFLAEKKITRQGLLWVVGGGVMGDLGGFAAASYLPLRG